MLTIDESRLKVFETIKQRFLSTTEIPEQGNWKAQNNDELWLKLVAQVMVVGSSTPFDRFKERPDLQQEVSYTMLTAIESRDEVERTINRVLRAVGTRYASADLTKCRKTQALAHNLAVLKGFHGGPKAFLTKLSEFQGRNRDQQQISYLMTHFKYVQSKSARDYLMELGLIQNAIALDVRIHKILQTIGIDLSQGFQNNRRLYDQIEADLLTRVCIPLDLSGVEFDRMLYQNYDEILTTLNVS